MIYEIAQQLIILIFLVVIVDLLVIPSVYKKLIIFYLQFMVIVIILEPAIRILDNEMTDRFNYEPFVSEVEFDKAVQFYQGQLEANLLHQTSEEISEELKQTGDVCGVYITDFELTDTLAIKATTPLTASNIKCLASELGLSETDITILEEEVNE